MRSIEKVPSSPPSVYPSSLLNLAHSSFASLRMTFSSSPFLLILISFFLASHPSFSQDRCPYKGLQQPASLQSTTVGNFTLTDTEGHTYDLYETLDSGMTVIIDLFFTRCTYCQQYSGIIEQVYQNTGAGEEDILMWGISEDDYDTNPIIDEYKANWGITNPCAGPQGGGGAAHATIISGQNFLGWPTYCVICPDRTMFFDVNYPPSVNGFNSYLAQCNATVGTEEHSNSPGMTITSVYPIPASDHLYIAMGLDRHSVITCEIYDATGRLGLKIESAKSPGKQSINIDLSTLPGGFYALKISQDGIFRESRSLVVR